MVQPSEQGQLVRGSARIFEGRSLGSSSSRDARDSSRAGRDRQDEDGGRTFADQLHFRISAAETDRKFYPLRFEIRKDL